MSGLDMAMIAIVVVGASGFTFGIAYTASTEDCANASLKDESAQPLWWRKAIIDARARLEKESMK